MSDAATTGVFAPDTATEVAPEETTPTGTEEKTVLTAEKTEEKVEETKAEDEAEEKETKAEDEAEEGAPESYEDFQVPETIVINEALMQEFKDLAKELDLSQTNAQKLADLHFRQMEDAVGQWDKMRQDWLKQAKADEEIGGSRFSESTEAGRRIVQEFGNDAFVEILETFGLGNHPEVIRFMSKVGEALGEDTVVTGGRETRGERTLAERIFPNLSPSH